MPEIRENLSGLFSVYLRMEIKIRRAEREDCPRMLELVQELATLERAPDEVTVTLEHFEQSGFGDNPVYWAFVAEENGFIVAFARGKSAWNETCSLAAISFRVRELLSAR